MNCIGKNARLRRLCSGSGNFAEPPLQPIVPSPLDYGYRNRITVHVEDGVVGFFRRDVHRLIDIERCPISAPAVNDELAVLRARRPRDGHYTLRAHSGPRVFSQTNDAVAEKLAEAVERAHSAGPERFSSTLIAAPDFSQSDWRANFLASLGSTGTSTQSPLRKQTATANESYFAGDLAAQLENQLSVAEPRLTTVIVDPPATGLSAEVRDDSARPSGRDIALRLLQPAHAGARSGRLVRRLSRLRA